MLYMKEAKSLITHVNIVVVHTPQSQVWLVVHVQKIQTGKTTFQHCNIIFRITKNLLLCIEVLQEALLNQGNPEIFNSDQRSQFTSTEFTDVLKENKITISMDGRGRALDNIFIERLWRSVKYECIYLNAFENGARLYYGLDEYFRFYNTERKHQSLDNQTPESIYTKIA